MAAVWESSQSHARVHRLFLQFKDHGRLHLAAFTVQA